MVKSVGAVILRWCQLAVRASLFAVGAGNTALDTLRGGRLFSRLPVATGTWRLTWEEIGSIQGDVEANGESAGKSSRSSAGDDPDDDAERAKGRANFRALLRAVDSTTSKTDNE